MVPQEITNAIQTLEADIKALNDSFFNWDGIHDGLSGSKLYREKAARIVLQAKKVESLIKENTFSR